MISPALWDVQFERDATDELSFPLWPCPVCGHGLLRLSDRPIHRVSSAQVAFGIDEGFLERWDDRGVFCAAMMCANDACRQGVVVIGDYSYDTPDGECMVVGRGPEFRVVCRYVVQAIHPAPKFINIPQDTQFNHRRRSAKLLTVLDRSTGDWSDPRACAAAIRAAIEETADNLRERRLDKNGKPISLGTHLKDLGLEHPNSQRRSG